MSIRRYRIVSQVLRLALLCIVLLMVGWSGAWTQQRPTVAVMPFVSELIEDPARGAVCPICGGVYGRGNIPQRARDILTRLVEQKLRSINAFQVMPSETVEDALSRVSKTALEENPTQAGLQIGKELGANFVLMGFVFRFDERVGSPMGVEKPASVGFDLHLLRTRDGRIVWTGRFNETQRPLSEDITKIGFW